MIISNLSAARTAAVIALAASALGCADAGWTSDVSCIGSSCHCDVDEDCTLTGYHTPVLTVQDCYCIDTSCGTSVPRRNEVAEANQSQWEARQCVSVPGLCDTTAHCALHPPERAVCRDQLCSKDVQQQAPNP